MKLLIKMSYDGQNFNGWQCQQSGRTVQDVLEESLKRLTGIEIKVCGSGRTDSGVHALAQYAHFEFPFDIDPDKLVRVLNAKLPPDLKIISAELVKSDFNARYSACSRSYKYLLSRESTPFNYSYKSFIPKLNYSLEQISQYLPIFLGEHDFTLFSKVNPDLHNRFCRVISFTATQNSQDIVFLIKANRFLHHMVRRIVGAILMACHTNQDPETFVSMLDKCQITDQRLLYTAPPQGLYLIDVEYPEDIFL